MVAAAVRCSILQAPVAREAMSRVLLEKDRLRPFGVIKGFLLFKAYSPQPTDWSRDGMLVPPDLQSSVGGRQTLDLPFSDANP